MSDKIWENAYWISPMTLPGLFPPHKIAHKRRHWREWTNKKRKWSRGGSGRSWILKSYFIEAIKSSNLYCKNKPCRNSKNDKRTYRNINLILLDICKKTFHVTYPLIWRSFLLLHWTFIQGYHSYNLFFPVLCGRHFLLGIHKLEVHVNGSDIQNKFFVSIISLFENVFTIACLQALKKVQTYTL